MSIRDRIKSNFALLGIIGAIILVIFLMIISNVIDRAVRPGLEGPGGVSQDGRGGRDGVDLPYRITGGNLKVVSASPSDMPIESLDTFGMVVFEFSEPVDVETLEIKTSPSIELETRYSEDFPTRISLVPSKTGWRPETLYTVTINSLKSTSGENLNEPFEYEYYNIPPDLSDFLPPL